jgi:hypothetical protein
MRGTIPFKELGQLHPPVPLRLSVDGVAASMDAIHYYTGRPNIVVSWCYKNTIAANSN